MKKIKFLSCAALAAFMAFGLASCEKENFSTDTNVTVTPPTINIPGIEIPDGYQPGDAVVSIQPTVNALINGTINNVTEKATIKFNGVEKKYEVLTGKTIAAQEIIISVSYIAKVDGFEKELTASEIISIPALQAGMVAIITPTIWLSATTEGYNLETGISAVTDEIKKENIIENKTDYWYSDYDATLKYVKEGSYLISKEIMPGYENDKAVVDALDTYAKGLSTELEYAEFTLENINVYAQSLTIIPFSQTKVSTEYEIKKGITWSRSSDIKTVAKFTIEEYGTLIVGIIKENINLEGEGHGHGNGHGHGHGHGGNDNAGGSIVDAL
ncbi:MAG: DUF3869 domain-containing protein [Bacteroides sp.]|nr:DUF3869 domain-containing protein [Bacteroides sp.]